MGRRKGSMKKAYSPILPLFKFPLKEHRQIYVVTGKIKRNCTHHFGLGVHRYGSGYIIMSVC